MTAKRISIAILLAAMVVQLLLRLHTIDEPLDCDEAIYAYIAHRLIAGDRMYVDVFENKPPGTYAIFASAIALGGYREISIRMLPIPFVLGTMALLWWIGLQTGSFVSAAVTAALFALTASDPYLFGNSANLEVFVNFFLILALALGLMARFRQSLVMWFPAGLSFGCATLIKQNVAIHLCAFGLMALQSQSGNRPQRSGRFRNLALLFTGVAVMWGVAILWAVSHGIFAAFYDAIVTYSLKLTQTAAAQSKQNPFVQLFAGDRDNAWWATGIWPVVVFLLLMALTRITDEKRARWRLFILLWNLLVFVEIFLTGMSWQHYYLLLLPGCVLMAGQFADRILVAHGLKRAAVAATFTALVATTIFLQWKHYLSLPSDTIAIRSKGGNQWVELRKLGRALQQNYGQESPQFRIFVWGWQTPIHFYSQLDSVTPYFFTDPLMKSQLQTPQALPDPRQQRILSDLAAKQPEFISIAEKPYPELLQFVNDRYASANSTQQVALHEGRGLYLRKDLFDRISKQRQGSSP